MDFFRICEERKETKRSIEIRVFPDFDPRKPEGLMIRGNNFYAIWNEKKGLWSTDEYDVVNIIDEALYRYADALRESGAAKDASVNVAAMRHFSSGSWSLYQKYRNSLSDNWHPLDTKLTFLSSEVKKEDYVSKRLPYDMCKGEHKAFDELIETLYEPEERKKILWVIGSIFSGDSQRIEKFLVLYGKQGTGKGTVLKIIEKLFSGYCSVFSAKSLGGGKDFATEAFKGNPLVAIDPDGDLSRIEDNTTLNTIVSHEQILMNEKYHSQYPAKLNCFLFMGTNKPVKITDSKSGLIRRLIDVEPSGRKIPPDRYHTLMSQVEFELGAIAEYCLRTYRRMGVNYYEDYEPRKMMLKTDEFYNFVEARIDVLRQEGGISLQQAYTVYKEYCEQALVRPTKMYLFREELKDYFEEFCDITRVEGRQVRSYYKGFRMDAFGKQEDRETPEASGWISLSRGEEGSRSALDELCAECPAQYAYEEGPLEGPWESCPTKLKDIDPTKLHHVLTPETLITIDFDKRNEKGEKDLSLNVAAANKWPPTYCEVSKGGQGLHLHYIWTGSAAVSMLSSTYEDGVEIKAFPREVNGEKKYGSLRRRLTLRNDYPIAELSGGLPIKEAKTTVNKEAIENEKHLKALIEKALKKKVHADTKSNMDYIRMILDKAYEEGVRYDLRSMWNRILTFARNSTNQSKYCVKLMNDLKLASEEPSENGEMTGKYTYDELVFFDVEVFINLFVVVWKIAGEDKSCIVWINPGPKEIETLLRCKLVGFNCRRYDNHILYAAYMGYDTTELYYLSQRIISGDRNAFFREAYNLSYTDIYDFSAKKQSLKKFEIELKIRHHELNFPWDQPVPKESWELVASYCKDDVLATEAVFNSRKSDFTARSILAALTGLTVNDTTNALTTRFIFGKNTKPQSAFNYRDMSGGLSDPEDGNYNLFDEKWRPIFPGYRYDAGKSTYRGEEVGEGGYVYAEPGVYYNVALLDVASMHPSSIVAEKLFGDEYTKKFEELLKVRVAIKHKDYDAARKMMDGKLAPYLQDEDMAKDLSKALKIAINSVYGLTAAGFENPFRDLRNKDNIVAKRGALFMINLKHEVQKRGYTVAHIKTDSIKIPNADEEIISFVVEYGKRYGYTFEHEDTYQKMCLVNDAVYIAKYASAHKDKKTGKEVWWTATGAQFQVPYVFKSLFSREPIEFDDLGETKQVTSALYLDMNEKLGEDEHNYQFIGRIGRFTPVIKGAGGGLLMREKNGKYNYATGAKGRRWMESETVRMMHMEDKIDMGYFNKLKDEALDAIAKYVDPSTFIDD